MRIWLVVVASFACGAGMKKQAPPPAAKPAPFATDASAESPYVRPQGSNIQAKPHRCQAARWEGTKKVRTLTVAADWVHETDPSNHVTIHITDPKREKNWTFGMVDMRDLDGPLSEDCLVGEADRELCHPIHPGDSLQTVRNPDNVVEGSTTLFDRGHDPWITYFLMDTNGCCFVWGHSTSHYDAFDCEPLF